MRKKIKNWYRSELILAFHLQTTESDIFLIEKTETDYVEHVGAVSVISAQHFFFNSVNL